MKNLLNWHWWNEKTISVYEGNWYEWIVPRYYLLIVGAAYITMLFLIIYILFGGEV